MAQKAPFEMELGGQSYRPALDLNAILCIQRETGHSHEVLLARIADPDTATFARVDALRTLVWAMIYTDCGKRLKLPHPSLAEVGCWFQDDSENVSSQVKEFFGIEGDTKMEGSLAPFVPTPPAVVKKMVELAEILPYNHCVDLGAGDGRLLFAALEASDQVTATGYEKHPERYEALRVKCEGTRANVIPSDIRKAALENADVVFLYLLPGSNAELKAKLLRELKPGARVVSHDFDMPDWLPDAVDVVKAEGRPHRVYMWRISEARIADAAVRAA